MRKITETETAEYFLVTREQLQLVFDLFVKLGTWKMLEILDAPKGGAEEQFIDDFWEELDDSLEEDS